MSRTYGRLAWNAVYAALMAGMIWGLGACQTSSSATTPKQKAWGTVYFPLRSTTVDPRSLARLDALAEELKANPSATVRLTGHAYDDRQSSRNMGTAKRRAEAVAAHLAEKGVAADRIRTDSRGDSDPRIAADNFGERKKNNRVEVYLQ